MLKICSNCISSGEGRKMVCCKDKRVPIAFIDNPDEFGCIFFQPNENIEICESCDGTGSYFSGGEIELTNSWLICDKCNGEGLIETKS